MDITEKKVFYHAAKLINFHLPVKEISTLINYVIFFFSSLAI